MALRVVRGIDLVLRENLLPVPLGRVVGQDGVGEVGLLHSLLPVVFDVKRNR